MAYTGETTNFEFPYMQDGDTMEGTQEAAFHVALDAILQACIDAVGVGVISGGVGSIVAGDLALTALQAIVPDVLGGVYVEKIASTVDDALFSDGVNYVHCQLTATSRTDQTCTYYVDASPTPASDAITICKVTKAGGVLTAVDNTVKAVPAIAARIPWEVLQRSYDDSTTLLAFLTAALGAEYMGGAPPDDVDTRLDALEAGGGGGGGGTVYWNPLAKASGDPTTIVQQIAADIAAHLAAAHAGGGGGGEPIDLPWDVDALNQAKHLLKYTRSVDPEGPVTQIDAVTIVWNVYGDGSGGTTDWVDRVNSTWLPA